MKVAIAGDWHCNLHWARKAIRYAADQGAEFIVHTGDFGYMFPAEYLDGIEKILRELGLPLWFVDGNHEKFPNLFKYKIDPATGRRPLRAHIEHLPRGYRWQWANGTWLAMGGAYSVDRPYRDLNHSWWIEETIKDEEIALVTKPADILISHDCPTGVDIPRLADSAWMWTDLDLLRSDEHRAQLRRVVEVAQPKAIFHGHYHRHYVAQVDFDYGHAQVVGLDKDESTMQYNITFLSTKEVL